MPEWIRARLTYSQVVSTLALVVAVGLGTAWALERNSVESRHIAKDAVTPNDIARIGVLEGSKRVTLTDESGGDSEFETLSRRVVRLEAECRHTGPGGLSAGVAAVATADDTTVVDDDGDTLISPPDDTTVVNTSAETTATVESSRLIAVTPGGKQVTGFVTAGVNVAGDDCVFTYVFVG
jgi:hypothetical protein